MILSEEEKELLFDSDHALLIHGFARTSEQISKLDECVIGVLGETPEEAVAVYSYERLSIALWFIQCGGDPEMDLEEWDTLSCNDKDSSGEEYDLEDAEANLSRSYLHAWKKGSYLIVSEYNETERFLEANKDGGDRSGTFLFRGSYLPIISHY
jgi:hypothetical protein